MADRRGRVQRGDVAVITCGTEKFSTPPIKTGLRLEFHLTGAAQRLMGSLLVDVSTSVSEPDSGTEGTEATEGTDGAAVKTTDFRKVKVGGRGADGGSPERSKSRPGRTAPELFMAPGSAALAAQNTEKEKKELFLLVFFSCQQSS